MKSSPVQRTLALLLRPFTKVHPDEAVNVAVMTLAAFLLLSAYYLLKTVREPLILLQGGAEVKLYARAGQAVIMAGFVHFYGELAKRVGRMRLLTIVFLFFVSNLVVFAVLQRAHVEIGLAFFFWVGVFSYTIVAQFWALAADIYTDEQGKRLFPIIGAGSSIGAVAGARFAQALIPLGPAMIMAIAVGILLVCLALIVTVERRAAAAAPRTDKAHPDEPLATQGAFRLIAGDRYLLLIAGLVILLNWVNSSGEYLLDRSLIVAAKASAHGSLAAQQQFVGAFKANYFAWYNLVGLVLQLFAVSRIFALVGVRGALLFMPAFSLLAYATAAVRPTLAVLRVVKIGENGTQYSLQDTTRNALFLMATRAEKFVGKTAVDTVAVRVGAILSALAVYTGTHLGWSTSLFATINVVLACGWLTFALLIRREHARREAAAEPRPSPTPVPA